MTTQTAVREHREHRVRRGLPELPRLPLTYLAPLAVLAGLLVGQGVHADRLVGAWWYLPAAGLLLATGLYGSTQGIDRGSLRRDLRTVVLVVTVGVLVKAALIAAVMVLAFRKPEYLVLGITVAQIDPLSVAAMSGDNRMSPRAKSLLAVWAAFDDPMTVLLSLYFSVIAFHLTGHGGVPALVPEGGGAAGYALNIGLNVALCAAAFGVWLTGRRVWARVAALRAARAARAARSGGGPAGRFRPDAVADVVAVAVVVAVVITAAATMLMLAVALTGLLVRTGRFRKRVDSLVTGAFLLASLGLGMLLAGGVSPVRGIVLGVAAFGAQAVVAWTMVPRMLPDLPRDDTVFLALGQQNGITAIILALALEPDFPGTVGIVGPAILTINVLYHVANRLWAGRLRSREAAFGVHDRMGAPAAVKTPARAIRSAVVSTGPVPNAPGLRHDAADRRDPASGSGQHRRAGRAKRMPGGSLRDAGDAISVQPRPDVAVGQPGVR